jgi:hypothetical protein
MLHWKAHMSGCTLLTVCSSFGSAYYRSQNVGTSTRDTVKPHSQTNTSEAMKNHDENKTHNAKFFRIPTASHKLHF